MAQVSAAGVRKLGQKVGQARVAPGVVLEVVAQTAQEVGLADERHELLERRGALGVGDAVEVGVHRLQVNHVSGDRVGGGQLILPVRPRLALVGECRPSIGEAGRVGVREVAGPLGEGLVEPQVIPPAHRDQVAEPHVRHLVQDRVRAGLVRGIRHPRPEDVVLPERDTACVLHRTSVKLRHKELVVLVECIGHTEDSLEELEALPGDEKDVIDIHELGQGLAAEDTQGVLAVRT